MSDLTDALAICVRLRVPVILWGGPGTGKTSVVQAMAKSFDLPCEVVIAAIREPSDFAGLPIVTAAGVTMAPPSWAVRLRDAGRGILFLDEISTAPPAVQAALLRVVLERTVGDLELTGDVAIVAAANPPDEAADGWDLAAPLANRFCHLEWSITANEFAEGLVAGFAVPAEVKLDVQLQKRSEVRWRGLIGSFLASRPNLVHELPATSLSGRAWPSPRSWTMAAGLLAGAEAAQLPNTVQAMVLRGAVGPSAAAEFLQWADGLDLPDPHQALLDPASFRLPARTDKAYAALMSLTSAVLESPTPERWTAAWQAIAAAVDHGGQADLAIVAVRRLIGARPAGATPTPESLRALTPVLKSAGMLDSLMSN
jgi:hypothetical protein